MAHASFSLSQSLLHLPCKRRLNLTIVLLVAAFGMASFVGCGSNNQRLQQLQNENDRLLSEYRAQRDQVTQLNERLVDSQSRLAESEKLLARQSPLPSSRLSRLNNEPYSVPQFGQAKDRSTNSASPTRPDTSANSPNENPANSDVASELYWRPMRREMP